MTRVINLKLYAPFDIDCTRNGPLGNPFIIGRNGDRDNVIRLFRIYFYKRIERDPTFRDLVWKCEGKVLGCVCKPQPCHVDVIKGYLDARDRSDG